MKNDIKKYKKKLIGYINNVDENELVKVTKIIKDTIQRGNRIFIVGNGGSISTANHFAEDLMLNNKYKSRVIVLDSPSVITAIANDFRYEDIFVKQLENLFDAGDLLVTISASGMSQNLIEAIIYANKLGSSISISGFDGGHTKKLATNYIYVKSTVCEYEETEDVHSIICHMIVKLVKESK